MNKQFSTEAQTVLITGGAGFIGHTIIEYLLETTNFNIVSLDRLDTAARLDRIHDVISKAPAWKDRVKIVWHDLKAPLSSHVIDSIGVANYILHLAAGSHVDRSIKYPLEFVMDNVVGTCNLLDYARSCCEDLKLFLYFSTDEVFGPALDGVVFDENSRYNAGNPYAATKAGAEELCTSFYNTYKLPIIVTHTMNVYGPRQHPEKYIPLVIKKLLNDELLTVHSNRDGTESAKRCYLHSKDIAAAIRFLMFNHKVGEKYNICADKETSNLDLAKNIAYLMNKELKYNLKYPNDIRPGNDFRYAISGDKIQNMGWKQKIHLNEGLKKTIEWYINNEHFLKG